MNRLKTFGLAAVLALALTAFAGVASASASHGVYLTSGGFAADSYPAYIAGTDTNDEVFFTTQSGDVNLHCESVELSGQLPEAGQALGITDGVFSGCKADSFVATVDMNECIFAYTILDMVKHTGAGHVLCPEGSAGIEITEKFAGYTVCTTTIVDRYLGKGAWYWGFESGSHHVLAIGSEFSNVEYTLSSPSEETCPKADGTYTDGVFTSGGIAFYGS